QSPGLLQPWDIHAVEINPEGVASFASARSGFAGAQVATPSGLKPKTNHYPGLTPKHVNPGLCDVTASRYRSAIFPNLLTRHA
ncbi:MAG TPA: hypothetical protein VIJ87_02925, partial [Pyrinomonadaceae bacterium]